jgi:hypothetical protein
MAYRLFREQWLVTKKGVTLVRIDRDIIRAAHLLEMRSDFVRNANTVS